MKSNFPFKMIALFILLTGSTVFCIAQDKKVISLLDLTGTTDAKAMTDFVFDALYESVGDQYRIIDSSLRNTILQEQKFFLSGLCDDLGCALEVGKLLAADYLILGRFSAVEGERHLVLRLVNVNTSEIEGISTTKIRYLEDFVYVANEGIAELLGLDTTFRNSEEVVSELLKLKPSTLLLDDISMGEKLLLRDRTDSYPWWLVAGIASIGGSVIGGEVFLSSFRSTDLNPYLFVAGVMLATGSIAVGIFSFSMLSRFGEWFRTVDDLVPLHLK